MAGLVPAIHALVAGSLKDVDARHKAGHDESEVHGGHDAPRGREAPYSAGLAEPLEGFGPVMVAALAFFSTMRTAQIEPS
jgi:hypothetical protein